MMRAAPPPLAGTVADVADLIALRSAARSRREMRAERASGAGSRLTRLRGRGIDFAEVRLYQPGDDVRSIDWRVTARKAKVHTKVFREERERPTLVATDQRRTMYFGSRVRLKSVAAAEAAALLAWHAVDAGDRVGGLVFDDAHETLVRPRRDPRTVVHLLGVLARATAALEGERRSAAPAPAEVSLNRALDHLLRAARTGYRIYLLSDFAGLDAAATRRLARLGRHNSVVAVHLFDALEAELPPPGRYVVRCNGERAELDAHGDARARYAQRFAERRARIDDACRGAHARLLSVPTDEPIASRLTERLLH